MTHTKKCIRCGKFAKMWTGHLLKKNGKQVLAGWCSQRCITAWKGYYGPFLKKHGEESTE
jgi:hypothetical protein